MPEEIEERGRPPKTPPSVESEVCQNTDNAGATNEFCTYTYTQAITDSIFNCGVYDYFTKEEIDNVLRNPIVNYDTAIRLSEFVYGKNGIVSNSIDYMTALMTLDKIVVNYGKTQRSKRDKDMMESVLKMIDDKQFIRDALFTEMLDGIAFYYFEVAESNPDKKKYLRDSDVGYISEINSLGMNATIITLPWKYTKIVGRKNNRYVLAFNLRYFDAWNGEDLTRKLRKYPKEIVDGYLDKNRNGDWLVLDSNKTMCRKIKCKNTEPWGRSLIISALSDVLYKDYFTDTKRNVLDEINNKVLYETYPENKQGNGSSLSKQQQEIQHNTVKHAITTKNNRGGLTFISLAAGTKIDTLDVSTDIFDEKNEANLNNDIAVDLGICASLIGAMSTGTFAGGQQNLEMITSQIYTWVCEWKNELVHVINSNIIHNSDCDIYYFPTSFVNRKQFFDMVKDLYMNAGGSLTFLIASAGIDVGVYLNTLDYEIEEGYFEKYLPHATSYTTSGNDEDRGRPETDNPAENTVKSRNSNGNSLPSPSDSQ